MNPSRKPLALKEVLLYDPSVQSVGILIEGMRESVVAKPLVVGELVMSAIGQTISDPEIRCLHILGHGAPGEVHLGGKRVDADTWRAAFELAAPRNNTNPIQINFWSCKTGEGETGMNFINTVAQTSNAFVNAASGFVGHNELGGTWDLDVSAKPVAPFSVQAREGFRQVLAPAPVNLTVAQVLAGGFTTPYNLVDTPTAILNLTQEQQSVLDDALTVIASSIGLPSTTTYTFDVQQLVNLESKVDHFDTSVKMVLVDTAQAILAANQGSLDARLAIADPVEIYCTQSVVTISEIQELLTLPDFKFVKSDYAIEDTAANIADAATLAYVVAATSIDASASDLTLAQEQALDGVITN